MPKKAPAKKTIRPPALTSAAINPKKLLKKKAPKKLPYEGWNPFINGVSQSLLQKFQTDTERYHMRVVRGYKETDRKEAMEYGTIFHKLDEIACNMGTSYTRAKMVIEVSRYLKSKYPSEDSALLGKIAVLQYHHYKEWEKTRPQYTHIEQEPVFNEPFQLPALNFKAEGISITVPSGLIIPLRGRIDGIVEKDGMWIKENKTKGQINLSHIQDTIHANIQVMMYALCSELKYKRPCKGVIYNVIRKPGLRQKVKESDADFLLRIEAAIIEDPDYYFYRMEVAFAPGQVHRWVREEFLPLMYRMYIWWKSIEQNPLEPWTDSDGNVNPFHGRKSFGIYDPMVLGKGDFYNLIVYGRKQGLIIEPEQFPELQDDDD